MNHWNDYGVSVFTAMTEEASKCGAINLAQGFPDYEPAAELILEAKRSLDHGFNQYAPSFGFPQLREAIAAYVNKRYRLLYDPQDEISVFSGASEALFCAFTGLCEPGDEVLGFEPYFDIYPGFSFAAKAIFKTVRLGGENWTFDPDELRKKVTPRTKAILLNTPHNPTGKVFSLEEMKTIAAIACEYNLFVVSDEVYEELVYAPAKHHPMATLPGMKERTIFISSAAKTFHVTGWKVGYACGPKEYLRRMRIVHQHTVFCSATPLQKALIKAYQFPDSYFAELRRSYVEQRDYLLSVLHKSGFRCQVPQGTYFIMADYQDLSKEDDMTFAFNLTRTVGVASIPLSVFCEDKAKAGKEKLVRFCFAKKMETLKLAAERLI